MKILAYKYESFSDGRFMEKLSFDEPDSLDPTIRNITALIDATLVSSDGNFHSVPEQCINDSYLLSCAEASLINDSSSRDHVADTLVAYCDGDLTWEEAMKALEPEEET